MDYATALGIWRDIRSSSLDDLRQDLIELAVRYARIRLDYVLAEVEKKAMMEPDRTACHNALIASCDILARNMRQRNESATWRQQLGQDRKTIGDFACFLHAILGICAR